MEGKKVPAILSCKLASLFVGFDEVCEAPELIGLSPREDALKTQTQPSRLLP